MEPVTYESLLSDAISVPVETPVLYRVEGGNGSRMPNGGHLPISFCSCSRLYHAVAVQWDTGRVQYRMEHPVLLHCTVSVRCSSIVHRSNGGTVGPPSNSGAAFLSVSLSSHTGHPL